MVSILNYVPSLEVTTNSVFLTCGPRSVGMFMPVSSLHLSPDCVEFLS